MSPVPGLVLVQHLAATHRRFIMETGGKPRYLALGRWDARELAHYLATTSPVVRRGGLEEPLKPSEWLRRCRAGVSAWGVEVKVDCRVGRMPGALWWLA